MSRSSASSRRISSSIKRAVVGQPAEQRGRYCVRLLGDLLQHEGAVAALLGGGDIPVDVKMPTVDDLASKRGDGHAVRR